MSVNRILSKKTFGSVVAQGKKLTISAAIETTHWWRPEFAADLLKEPLERAIENTPEKIPPWAEDACARYKASRQASSSGLTSNPENLNT